LGWLFQLIVARVKLSDEVTVNLENIRTQIEPDRAEARSFWSPADMHLTVAQQARDAKQIAVLTGGGFNQLYWAKPTFGANGWGDYFALLALGFGTEATRNVVTQVANKSDASTL
jgi:hypothetical protein